MKFTVAGLAVLVVALSIALGIKSCEKPPEPKIPPALQAKLDSLTETRKPFEQARDSVIRIVVHDTVAAAGSNARSEAAVAAAATSQHEADSIARVAALHADSAALWREAYEAQKRTDDSLRVALAAKDSAYRFERAARISLLGVVHRDSLRLSSMQDAQDRLVRRISELEPPCKVIGPIKCPSRKAVMLATAAAIVVVDARRNRD